MTTNTTATAYNNIQKQIYAQQQKIERMQEFLMRRSIKLDAAADAINLFLKKNKLVLIEYSNAYTTGFGDSEYGNGAHMLITCNVTNRSVKDLKGWGKRIEQRWNNEIKPVYGVSMDRAISHGAVAELKLRVYP